MRPRCPAAPNAPGRSAWWTPRSRVRRRRVPAPALHRPFLASIRQLRTAAEYDAACYRNCLTARKERMPSLTWYLSRLQTMSAGELAWRMVSGLSDAALWGRLALRLEPGPRAGDPAK